MKPGDWVPGDRQWNTCYAIMCRYIASYYYCSSDNHIFGYCEAHEKTKPNFYGYRKITLEEAARIYVSKVMNS